MDFIEQVDHENVEKLPLLAESDQFAMYAAGDGTYLLVQRHAGTPWTAVPAFGDGVFRVGALLVDAMRHLYRDVAGQLSPNRGF